MALYTGDRASIVFIPVGMDGFRTITIRARSWNIRIPSCDLSDRYVNIDPSYSPIELSAEGHIERANTNKALTDAQHLAYAVLHEDPAAALALADEVQLRHLQPRGFVPRAELEARIRELEERNADLEREINIRKASGRNDIGGVW